MSKEEIELDNTMKESLRLLGECLDGMTKEELRDELNKYSHPDDTSPTIGEFVKTLDINK